jgi:hypothetical protein
VGLSPLNTVPESASVNPTPPTVSNIADSPNYGFLVLQASGSNPNQTWTAVEYGESPTTPTVPFIRTTCTTGLNGQISNCVNSAAEVTAGAVADWGYLN